MQIQEIKFQYEAPEVTLFNLNAPLNMLITFSADAEFEDYEDGGDLDFI